MEKVIETHKPNSLTPFEQRKDNQGLLEKHRLTTRSKKIELHVIEVFNNNVWKALAAEADREHWGVCYNMEAHQRAVGKDNLFKTFSSFIFA